MLLQVVQLFLWYRSIWDISEKKAGGLRTYFFEPPLPPKIFTMPLEIPDKATSPLETPQNSVTPL